MVIRARLVHNILDGFLFRASTIVLSDRLSHHREAGQREFSPIERPGAVCGAHIAHYLEPDIVVPAKQIPKAADKPTELIPNPEYETWVAKDQQIVNNLLSNISKEIQVQVSNCATSAKIWKVISEMTAS